MTSQEKKDDTPYTEWYYKYFWAYDGPHFLPHATKLKIKITSCTNVQIKRTCYIFWYEQLWLPVYKTHMSNSKYWSYGSRTFYTFFTTKLKKRCVIFTYRNLLTIAEHDTGTTLLCTIIYLNECSKVRLLITVFCMNVSN